LIKNPHTFTLNKKGSYKQTLKRNSY
jgi:hypothetical protein